MSLLFEPKKSEVFKIAQLILVLDSLLIVVIRVVVITTFFFLSIFFAQSFAMGILFILASFEIFYQFKIKQYTFGKMVLNFTSNDNLADVFDLGLAGLYILASGSQEKFLKLFLENPELKLFLQRAGIKIESIEKFASQNFNLQEAFEKGFELAQKRGANNIDSLDVLQALFLIADPFKKLAFDVDVGDGDLENVVFWVREEIKSKRKPFVDLDQLSSNPGIAQDWISGYTLETAKYTRDVTKKLTAGQPFPYLVGRGTELSQIEEILARDRKKNVILVGEPGVGKSTIVYSLAKRCFSGQVIPQLRYKRILELSIGGLLSGANLGELERRLQNILAEIENAGDVIFYIPAIENIAGATTGLGQVDVTGVLLPTLRGAAVQVIGATIPKAYTRYIESRSAFATEFDKVMISEPSESDAVKIAEQAVIKIEKSQKVTFAYKAVLAAVTLSDRYMKDRVLPGKAIDLLDQVGVRIVQSRRNEVLEDDVVNLVSEKKKIPLELAKGEEQRILLNLEKILHQRIVDQEEAVEAVSQALRRARAFVREEKRPIGAFLFLGPTGVGKTETARALAQSYFGGEENIIRLDMSEFQTLDSVGRLIGSATGEEKGQLTEAVRAKSFALILLDEMEKAHKAVLQLFLQVFDEGRLTDATGVTVNFAETLIIATSNAGAEKIREAIIAKKDLRAFKDELIDFLLKNNIFTPEFLNRFDDVVLFKSLTEQNLKQIVKIQMKQVLENLAEQEITVEATENLLLWLVKTGYDPVFGARPLRRLIQDEIEGFLAKKILAGEIQRGDVVSLDYTGQEITFQKKGTKFAPL